LAGVKACSAQGLQAGPGLWFFTWQCQQTAGSDTTHFESDDHYRANSTQTGVQLSKVPFADAYNGFYPACLGIRVEQVKLQTRHLPHTGDRRYFMIKTSMFC